MKTRAANLNKLLVFVIILSSAFPIFADPLNLPGGKTITVGSEIERGWSEIGQATVDWLRQVGISNLNYLDHYLYLNRVFERNKSANTDSDGFMLGALLFCLRRNDLKG